MAVIFLAVAVMLLTGILVLVSAITGSGGQDPDEQELEDREQEEFLRRWAEGQEKKGKRR